MTPPLTINRYMYLLLVEHQLDAFTVSKARDVLMSLVEDITCRNEARRIVYRQLYRLESKGWLSTSGQGRDKLYSQTEELKKLQLKPASRISDEQGAIIDERLSPSMILKEKYQYEGELEITLGEIDEYQSLSKRFPNQRALLSPMLEHAKERSASLLGKINALSNVLKSLKKEVTPC